MKFGFLAFALFGLAGCASQHASAPAVPTTAPVAVAAPSTAPAVNAVAAADYEESSAVSLAFDPPALTDEPPLQLTRDERRPGAFVGFDGPITTSFWIHTDDWQDSSANNGGNNGWGTGGGGGTGDRYQRDAQFDQIGVRTR
jgi:hypothetical protein